MRWHGIFQLCQIELDNISLFKIINIKTSYFAGLLSGQIIQTIHVLNTININIKNTEFEFHNLISNNVRKTFV